MPGPAIRKAAVAAASLVFLAGCAVPPPPSAKVNLNLTRPIAIAAGKTPAAPVYVGVYSCTDTTGQHAPTGAIEELSTAVPQDCTPYLISALEAMPHGYYDVLEREHLSNLLTERQLAGLMLTDRAAQLKAAHKKAALPQVPPLSIAEIEMVGQVVAYDRQVTQASVGLAIGGIGGQAKYVTDLITFSLRAVSVTTGRVLKQVTVTKSVTSLEAGGTLDAAYSTTLLNAEAGGSTNEPVGLALALAARKAVAVLSRDGVQQGWWQFRDKPKKAS